MGYALYENYRPGAASMEIIVRAQSVITRYQDDGMVLTLRQLYYVFVASGWLENSDKNYERLGRIVSRARLGGYLDWDAIEDRNRSPVIWSQYENGEHLVRDAIQHFRMPRLSGQETYVELWVEKDALSGVLRPIAGAHHVSLMANKGYSSSSAMKEAGDRIRQCCNRYGSERAVVLYIGDLDPSGEDMVRDISDRLQSFVNGGLEVVYDDTGSRREVSVEDFEDMVARKPSIEVEVRKLALTIEQVRAYNPPPNPAKEKDSRAKEFIAKYGESSWEVDALPPSVLRDLIEGELAELLDAALVEGVRAQERAEIAKLEKFFKKKAPRKRASKKTKARKVGKKR